MVGNSTTNMHILTAMMPAKLVLVASMQLRHDDRHVHYIFVFCRQLRCKDMQVHHNGAKLYNGCSPLSSGSRHLDMKIYGT
jgi:hypothetical protein